MKPVALAGHADFRRAGRAIGLGLLFLLAPLLSVIQPEELVETSVHPSTFFTPAVNATGVNLTSTNMLSIPANETEGSPVRSVPVDSGPPPSSHRFLPRYPIHPEKSGSRKSFTMNRANIVGES